MQTKSILDRPVCGYLFMLGVLLAWEIAATASPLVAGYLPPLHRVLSVLWTGAISGSFIREAVATIARLGFGYLAAVAVALPLGFLIGYSRVVFAVLRPTLEMLRPAPAVAIIPIAMLFFGLDDRMKVFVVAWGCFWPVLISAIDGVRSVDPVLAETARAYGYRPIGLWLRIILPGALPYAMSGLRLGLTVSLVLAIFTEVYTGGDGLGFLLQQYNENARMAEMYSIIVLIAIIGFGLYLLFNFTERLAVGWYIIQRAGR
jgi:ABC-type nitrate/sulfonate/bicarbonate transport system permease component